MNRHDYYERFGDEPSYEEIQNERNRRRYVQLLHRFPDCRDPDHPGCPICNGADECDDPVDDDEGAELYCLSEDDLPTDDEEE